MEAMRCLRRRLSDAVYRQLAADALAQEEASPGGHPGASLISSAAGLSPDTGTSDQPLPGPADLTLPPPGPAAHPMAPAAAATRRRARGVNVERPAGRTTLTPNQRRRTLNSAGAMPLTEPFIEGSQKRSRYTTVCSRVPEWTAQPITGAAGVGRLPPGLFR